MKLRLPASQAGMSLVEVMVSMVIFSFGVLGMIALQANAIKFSVDAENRNRAALLASDLVAEMWAGKSTSLRGNALTEWQARVVAAAADGLPAGQGSLHIGADGLVTITLSWRTQAPNASNGRTSVYTTQMVMP